MVMAHMNTEEKKSQSLIIFTSAVGGILLIGEPGIRLRVRIFFKDQ